MVVVFAIFFFPRWSNSSTGNPRLVPSAVRKNSILKSGCEAACPSQARPEGAYGWIHGCKYQLLLLWQRVWYPLVRTDDVKNVWKELYFSESSDMTLL
jgi:hypothetical protein